MRSKMLRNINNLDRFSCVWIDCDFGPHYKRWDIVIGGLAVDVDLSYWQVDTHPVHAGIEKQQSAVWRQTDTAHTVYTQLRRCNHRHISTTEHRLISYNNNKVSEWVDS